MIFAGEAALALIRRVASAAGALMVLDDLHWSDAATLELLDYLADKLGGTGALVVATSRTGEGAAAERLGRRLRTRDAASVVELLRLSGDGVAAMVAAALGARHRGGGQPVPPRPGHPAQPGDLGRLAPAKPRCTPAACLARLRAGGR